jgi:hypothetical protein
MYNFFVACASALTERYRAQYRAQKIRRRYFGWAHFAFTSLGSLSIIAYSISRVRDPGWKEWLVVPLGFLVANLVEYFGHKGPMHHRKRFLGLIHSRHAVEHHRFFTDQDMAYESSRDFKMVLFPPIMLLFFLGGIATPIALILYFLVSANAGWIFIATGIGYFLTYEWLHFTYHLSSSSLLGRLKVIQLLRRHHSVHHNPALMQDWNFNITFPICDQIFGTTYPAGKPLAETQSLS